MQLLPLLIPVLCFLVAEAARHDDWKNRTNAIRDSIKDRSRNRFGNMTSEKKERLGKQIGDMDARKARLGRMQRRHKELTPEQKAELKQKLAKVTPIQTERPNENMTTNMLEVNMKEGLTEFMYQGDMDLTDEQIDMLKGSSDAARRKRQATTIFNKWTGNTVYYYYDSSISASKKAVFSAALQYIQSRTCLTFVQSSTATNRIKVYSGVGCFASLGMLGGEQTLSLGEGCEQLSTAAHEFMHALGIWHMQMRSDRDSYVTIDLTYVPESGRFNFDKLTTADSINYTPYEYGSIMHYDSNSFADPSDKLTIIPKDIDFVYSLQGGIEPSFYDIAMINTHYGCNAACPPAKSAQCYVGGVPNPKNCAVCICPFGYAGALCDQRPPGCGETVTATSSWQTKSFSIGDRKNPAIRNSNVFCNYWIFAPAGQLVEIQIVSMENAQCQNSCPINGMEIKTNADPRVSNLKYCCPEYVNKTILSYNNPTPLIGYNSYYYTDVTFKFRAVPKPAPPPKNCRSMSSAADCAQQKAAGFCTSPDYSFQIIKYSCAKECGLCGKAATPCVDLQADCPELAAAGACQVNDPMVLEYQCAKSCGYCASPN